MDNIKLLLFDLDDTLYDFSAVWSQSMRETMRTHRITNRLDTVQLYEALTRHTDSLREQLMARDGVFLNQTPGFTNWRWITLGWSPTNACSSATPGKMMWRDRSAQA